MAQGNISEFVICKLAEIAIDENDVYPKECQFLACVMLTDIGWGKYGKKLLNQRLKTIDMTVREFIARLVPPKKCIVRENKKGQSKNFYSLQLILAKQELRQQRFNRLIFTGNDLSSPVFLKYICPPPRRQKGKIKMKHWEPLKKLGMNKAEANLSQDDLRKLKKGLEKNINRGLYSDKEAFHFVMEQQWSELFEAPVRG